MDTLTHCILSFANGFCAICLSGVCGMQPRVDAPTAPPALSAYTITVSTEKPATINEEALTVELVAVTDNRCAQEVQCVWAGYAEVSLRVSKAGAGSGTVVVGTPAPESMSNGAPTATYGGYRFSLSGVEPGNSMQNPVPQARYRVTLVVNRS